MDRRATDLGARADMAICSLLGGMAPTCYVEQLIYDCRLMNEALADGAEAAGQLRRWLVRSDARLDPQAYILTPDSAVAGVFTRSLTAGAPVLWCRECLKGGSIRGIVVNSGNSNTFEGSIQIP